MAESKLKPAVALIDAGRIEEATKTIQSFLQENPNSAQAAYLLGVCYFRTKQFNLAESSFRKSISVDSYNHLAHYYLGLALERQDRASEANVEYQITLAIKPEFKEARQKLEKEQTEKSISMPQESGRRIDATLARTIETGGADRLSGPNRKIAGTLLLEGRRRYKSFSAVIVLMPVILIAAIIIALLNPDLAGVAIIVGAVLLITLGISSIARWRVTRYFVYEGRVDFRSGILFKKRISVWYFQIEDCWITRSPFNLITNDATLHIRTGQILESPSAGSGHFKITGLGNTEMMYKTWEELRDAALVERRAMKNIWV